MLSVVLAPGPVADVRLAEIFQSGMVLQRGNRTKLFGTANPGEKVTVQVGPAKGSGQADANGNFTVSLKTPAPGGPYTVEVRGAGGGVQRLDDVLVGDVWICSGQSNMEWEADWFQGRRFEIGYSDFPQIRLFKHAHRVSTKPERDAQGEWIRASATSARRFSLVGFLFGRQLHQKLKVPIGLIESAWGGTPAESWIDLPSLKAHPELQSLASKFRNAASNAPEAKEAYDRAVAAYAQQAFPIQKPAGASGGTETVAVPKTFEENGKVFDGVSWITRTVSIPKELAGKDLLLELGPIDDFDATYFNDERVGMTGPGTANAYSARRKYRVPGRLVKEGENVLSIKVVDTGGGGGPNGDANDMRLGDGVTWIPLAGQWGFRMEADFADPAAKQAYAPPAAPVGQNDPWLPTGLFNGMIAPVAPYTAKGAIWYQGESNVGRSEEYSVLFPEMIRAWRRAWQDPTFDFYFVQLASFGPVGDSTGTSGWAELREAQTAALKLKGVGMAVAIDAGEADDIHPIRKDVVAERLARAALAMTYKQKVAYRGPEPKSAVAEGSTFRIRLTHAEGLKSLDGKPPVGFAVAGPDGKFHVASARFVGSDVLLSTPKVSKPVAARYAWADYIGANVANGEGLAMAPFRLSIR
jgi:sialate O-acetylesterase